MNGKDAFLSLHIRNRNDNTGFVAESATQQPLDNSFPALKGHVIVQRADSGKIATGHIALVVFQ